MNRGALLLLALSAWAAVAGTPLVHAAEDRGSVSPQCEEARQWQSRRAQDSDVWVWRDVRTGDVHIRGNLPEGTAATAPTNLPACLDTQKSQGHHDADARHRAKPSQRQ